MRPVRAWPVRAWPVRVRPVRVRPVRHRVRRRGWRCTPGSAGSPPPRRARECLGPVRTKRRTTLSPLCRGCFWAGDRCRNRDTGSGPAPSACSSDPGHRRSAGCSGPCRAWRRTRKRRPARAADAPAGGRRLAPPATLNRRAAGAGSPQDVRPRGRCALIACREACRPGAVGCAPAGGVRGEPARTWLPRVRPVRAALGKDARPARGRPGRAPPARGRPVAGPPPVTCAGFGLSDIRGTGGKV